MGLSSGLHKLLQCCGGACPGLSRLAGSLALRTLPPRLAWHSSPDKGGLSLSRLFVLLPQSDALCMAKANSTLQLGSPGRGLRCRMLPPTLSPLLGSLGTPEQAKRAGREGENGTGREPLEPGVGMATPGRLAGAAPPGVGVQLGAVDRSAVQPRCLSSIPANARAAPPQP